MRRTSARRAILPMTLSRASRWQESSKRESASRKSPRPKSLRPHRSLDQVKREDRGPRNSGFRQQCSAAIEKPDRQQRASLLEGGCGGIHSINGIVQPLTSFLAAGCQTLGQCECVARQLSSSKTGPEARLRPVGNRSIVPGYENGESHLWRRLFLGCGRNISKIERRGLDSGWVRGRDEGSSIL